MNYKPVVRSFAKLPAHDHSIILCVNWRQNELACSSTKEKTVFLLNNTRGVSSSIVCIVESYEKRLRLTGISKIITELNNINSTKVYLTFASLRLGYTSGQHEQILPNTWSTWEKLKSKIN